MLGNQKWQFILSIAKPYAFDILEEIRKEPARFKTLEKLCSKKTLMNRLYDLQELKLIEKFNSGNKRQKDAQLYKITSKGEKILEIIYTLNKLK